MADFKTHLIGASLTSGIVASLLSFSPNGAVSFGSGHAMGYFFVGIVGGLLPDIDSESSIPIRIARRILSTVGTLLVVLHFAPRYSVVELVVLATGTYVLLKICFDLFDRVTVHRGLVHSLPTTACFGFATGAVAFHCFNASPIGSWFYVLFMTVGVFTHLVLDEISSVNLLGVSINRSFGSALSLGERDNLLGTVVLYGLAVLLFLICPTIDEFLSVMTDSSMYSEILNRVWPQHGWFA